MKLAMVESIREVCGSVRVGGGSPKSVWCYNEVKAAVKRKEAAWKEVLLEMKIQKKDVWKLTKKKRERFKNVYMKGRRR